MNDQGFVFSDPAPYPPVQVCGPNGRWAEMMLQNVGACHSEMSAVSLYFYNSVITEGRRQEISRCFQRISVVEMRHLDIFARLAFLLGADPRLWSGPPRRLGYWSPSCNSYPRDLAPMLQNAIHGEMDTISRYRQQSSCIADANIKAILDRVILDERLHVDIFQSLLRQL